MTSSGGGKERRREEEEIRMEAKLTEAKLHLGSEFGGIADLEERGEELLQCHNAGVDLPQRCWLKRQLTLEM